MNSVVISTHRRPFHTKLCLESIFRADRWHQWADHIHVTVTPHGDPKVREMVQEMIVEHGDPRYQWTMQPQVMNPHDAARWMLDWQLEQPMAESCLYVEDDAYLSPDAFAMCEWTAEYASIRPWVAGCCLYHETIPGTVEYTNRPPDPTLLHLANGLNTCGGTLFIRKPYVDILSPNWNCKQVEPMGFDYSAHYLMYLNKLYMVWPDLSRSINLGFQLGSCSPELWARYFGRSIWAQTKDAVDIFKMDDYPQTPPAPHREEWMVPELKHRGLL